ncbi:F0F1 ATP synthase subunit delta [Vagococcus coleopterorum]|uniref:ATP synthase subunit delta n=1 Tax=Vagococcus coleopterorum TaxID=2714946 RepID=A0A6G8ANM5_9ENTE|nr:ATP synthase F1 subunit delta [Vagococcus coleopterorum]QIL46678.1 F0F1 ATP synthase subunit delta [Vagococcus coleopterorum]
MKTENLTIDRRYGRILFETAKESDALDTVLEELTTLRGVYQEVPDMGNLLTDERLTASEKEQLFATLANQFGETVSNFLRVVFNNRRMQEIPQMISEFNFFYHEDKGVLVADVTSAVELTEEQSKQVEEKIAKSFDYDQVILEKHIDPEILGGLIIKAANKVIDSSVKKQLTTMHKQIVK